MCSTLKIYLPTGYPAFAFVLKNFVPHVGEFVRPGVSCELMPADDNNRSFRWLCCRHFHRPWLFGVLLRRVVVPISHRVQYLSVGTRSSSSSACCSSPCLGWHRCDTIVVRTGRPSPGGNDCGVEYTLGRLVSVENEERSSVSSLLVSDLFSGCPSPFSTVRDSDCSVRLHQPRL